MTGTPHSRCHGSRIAGPHPRSAGGLWVPAGPHFEGLPYEAAAVARAIAAGQLEVPQRPLAESIRTMAVADAVRNQLGIVFPGEAIGSP